MTNYRYSRPPYETAVHVNLYDGEHFHLIAANISLTDACPDDLSLARLELEQTGRYWSGGGNAPLFLLMRIRR